MPITIIRLLAFEGPHIYGPQPGVMLQVRCNQDRGKQIKRALKEAAQRIGLVIGYVELQVEAFEAGYQISMYFASPTPALGVELARYLVAGLQAQEGGDETWDPEESLWLLQKRRRAEALPLRALQIIAEASVRGLPSFVSAGGMLQLGYGARGMALDLAPLRDRGGDGLAADGPPWERLGVVPMIGISGPGQEQVAGPVAEALRAAGLATVMVLEAGFDMARALLADPATEALVLGLQSGELLWRGLPFDCCAAAALLGLPDELPKECASREELAQALGLPMLVTDPAGVVTLHDRTPEISALAEYAPCRLVRVQSTAEAAATLIDALRYRL